jgi:hypothetical protein
MGQSMIAPNPRIGQPKCTDLATPTIAPQAKMPNCCHDFSSSSSALCHFRAEFSRLIRRPERKSGLSRAKIGRRITLLQGLQTGFQAP